MYKKLIELRLELQQLEKSIIEQVSNISSFTEDEYFVTQEIVTIFPDKTIVTKRASGCGDNGESIWEIEGHEFWGEEQDVLLEIYEYYNK
jgi:hypothetical protein